MKQFHKYFLIFSIVALTGTGAATNAAAAKDQNQQQKASNSNLSSSERRAIRRKENQRRAREARLARIANNRAKTPVSELSPTSQRRALRRKENQRRAREARMARLAGNNPQQTQTPVAETTPPAPAPQPAPASAPPANVGSASLSWTIPKKRENGVALSISELNRYEIYYTSDSGRSETIRVDNPAKSSLTITNLQADTYYFAMAAVDKDGIFSELSNEAPKTVK
ncbi:MAG: fibronectin type III domain-containing protein [Pseudomonadales bacterium]